MSHLQHGSSFCFDKKNDIASDFYFKVGRLILLELSLQTGNMEAVDKLFVCAPCKRPQNFDKMMVSSWLVNAKLCCLVR